MFQRRKKSLKGGCKRKGYAPHRDHILSFKSSPYENRKQLSRALNWGTLKIKLPQYVSLLKSPNFDAANIKCFTVFGLKIRGSKCQIFYFFLKASG